MLTHGFSAASCYYVTILPELLKHYRIVMFDYLSFGNNPRTGVNRVDITNVDHVEEWLIEYWERWVAKVDLPEKFYLAGHSFGGYMSALYASRNPKRIKKVFFISPANFLDYDPTKIYGVYSFRTDDSPNPPPRRVVRKQLRLFNEGRSIMSLSDNVPACAVKRLVRRRLSRYADEKIT